MESLLRRWIASCIASVLILLAPGLPAYAQVARITVGEAGVPGAARGVLPGAGAPSANLPLTTLSPLLASSLSALSAASAPSAISVGAPASAAASAVAAPAAAALTPSAARAAAEGTRRADASNREAAAAPTATTALHDVARQASKLSAAPGTDVSDRAHSALIFDADVAPSSPDGSAPATQGSFFSGLRAALDGVIKGPASALKTAASLPAAASSIEKTAASGPQAAASSEPSFPRRTWKGIAGFARDLRTMAFGDKKLEPLLGDVAKPRLKAQIYLCLDALSNFGMSFLIGAMLDAAALAAKHGFAAEKSHLILLSGGLIGASLIYALIERTHALHAKVAQTRTAGAFRIKLQDNLVHQPMQFHQEHPSGELSSVMVKGVGYLNAQTTATRIPIFHLGLLLVFGAGMMVFVSPTLSVVTLALVPVLAWLAHHFQSRAWKIGERIADQRKELTRMTEESLAMHATVAAFGTQEFEAARHARSVNETAELDVESANLKAKYGLVAGLATALSQQLLYIVGGAAKLAGWGLSFGRVTALMLYAGLVQAGANGISSYHLLYQQASGSANEASALIKDEPKQTEAPGTPALPPGPGAIHFEDVTFSYPSRKAAPVLKGVDFKIEPGQTVAFVGTTGSGKSTVARLLLRQWDPTGGRISVDGRDVTNVTRKSLLARMAVVPQTVALFSRTLRENMTYGSEGVSEEALEAAIHRAGADDFLNDKQRFPKGLETKITGGGTSLSGGERQRVGIVRALLREPSILILDEATSALDAATERKVQRRIAAMTGGADGRRPTTLVIAHHLNTIRGADQIIVLETGQIVERGTHAELLALNGRYANLWKKGGYASSDDESVEAETPAGAVPVAEAPAAAAGSSPDIVGLGENRRLLLRGEE